MHSKQPIPRGPLVRLLLISPRYIGITAYVMPHPMPASIRPTYMIGTDVDTPIKIHERIFGIVVISKVPLRPILSISMKGTKEPMPTPTYIRFTIQAISSVVTSKGSSSLNFGMVGVLHPSWRPQSMIKILPGKRSHIRIFQRSFARNWNPDVGAIQSEYLHTNPITVCLNIPRSIVPNDVPRA